jgi:hypothetical protein
MSKHKALIYCCKSAVDQQVNEQQISKSAVDQQ